MTKNDVMQQLAAMGSEGTKKVLAKHGYREPFFGVKVGDMKTILKKVKKDNALALELYSTGNADAMYMAALIADENKITKKDLNTWAKQAYCPNLSEFIVAQLTAETPHAVELALKWIDDKAENVAASGWSTLSNYLSITPDNEIDVALIEKLLTRVQNDINASSNRVRYAMNAFVICVGSYLPVLNKQAKVIAKSISGITVNMGDTAYKLPDALAYINKVEVAGKLGAKRKMARC